MIVVVVMYYDCTSARGLKRWLKEVFHDSELHVYTVWSSHMAPSQICMPTDFAVCSYILIL